jgi:FemAB-related protein (PEP-CTERM system-associated)
VGADSPVTQDLSTISVECSRSPPRDWDDYVCEHAGSSAFQTASAVLIGSRAFGLRSHFVTVRGLDGRLRGVLPLVEQVLIPWSRCLVSLPFCTYGGPLADDDKILVSLIRGAERVADQQRAVRIILRCVGEAPAIPYPASLDKVSMVLPLPDTKEEMTKRLGSKLRSQIRRADREKPRVRVGRGELLGDFYTVFCSVMRNLGTPVYPRRFFEIVFKALGERVSAIVLYLDDVPVSGAILIHWRDSVEVPWAATLHSTNPMAINMRLYWELLQLAIERRCTAFDFGRCTRNAGTYRFKAQWGAQPVQLYWHTRNLSDGDSVIGMLDGRSKLENTAVQVWSRLPLALANWLGPHISPRLPW